MNNAIIRFAAMVRSMLFDRDDSGATATEYAILVAFIALAIVLGVTLFGSQLNDFFSTLGSKIGIIS